MKQVKPSAPHAGASFVEIAKTQAQYETLPAYVDGQGLVQTEWEPTAEELAHLLNGGRVRLWVWTFGFPLQPLMLEAVPPIEEES